MSTHQAMRDASDIKFIKIKTARIHALEEDFSYTTLNVTDVTRNVDGSIN